MFLLLSLEAVEDNSPLFFPLSADSPLVGPLSQPQGDDTDGPEQDVSVDEERLQPRSDDEDT